MEKRRTFERCTRNTCCFSYILTRSRKKMKRSKYFYIFCFVGLIIAAIIWSQYHFRARHVKDKNLKYILQWRVSDTTSFIYLESQRTFMKKNCSVQSCYVTSDSSYFYDYRDFDVIAFHGPEIDKLWMPRKRSPHQKYAFVSLESSDYYPVCEKTYDGFFNWTWTYKLNSDEPFPYISIRNKQGDVIGPNEIMHWNEENGSIDENVREKLKRKNKAAAWFASNCDSKSKREVFTAELQRELATYNLSVDVYGKCGPLQCPRSSMAKCLKMIERDYYFYLSFENSFSEDYVTEKLLHALQNYAVPVVYGGANYTRFMPDGIYLDAKKLGAVELAKQMNDIIQNNERYYRFFEWHNQYSYHDSGEAPDTDAYCRFCAMANDPKLMSEGTVYNHFLDWWNPPGKC